MKEKNMNCLALFFFIIFLFSNCDEEEPVKLQEAHHETEESSETARKSSGPVANAGSDVSLILPVSSTVLDGSASRTFDGVIEYQWSKTAGPVSGLITDPASATTLVTDLTEGSYTFRLIVTDSKNRIATDQVIVTILGDTASVPPPLPPSNDLYFEGNMDNVSITTNNSKLLFNGWDPLKSHPYVETFEINNIGGIPYGYQQIRTDPVNTNRNALYAAILDDDPNVSGTTRAQMTMRFKDGVDLQVYHTSQRTFLQQDVSYLQNYSSSITWFVLFETWNKHVDAWDGDVAGSARWNLSIQKDNGIGQPLYWVLKSEYMQPANVAYDNIWKSVNKTVAIPTGRWFTLDIYMKRGEGTSGRLIVKITPDGGSTEVLFDINNSTVYPGHPEIQLKSWQAFKLYLDDAYLDWMRINGKTIAAYYNDFKWYKN